MRLKKVTLFEFYSLARVCFVVLPTVLLPAVVPDLDKRQGNALNVMPISESGSCYFCTTIVEP